MRPWKTILIITILAAAAIRVYTALDCDTVPDYSDMATYNRIALGDDAPAVNIETQSATRQRLYDKKAMAKRSARGSTKKKAHATSLETPRVSPPPGYPLFLKTVYGIFGKSNYKAIFLIQALLSTLTVFGIYYVTARVRDRATGIVAAAIAAIYPNFIIYNLTTLTESVSLLFVVLLMAALVHPSSGRKRSVAAALILFAGCAFRPPFLYFWPGIFTGVKKKLLFVTATAIVVLPLMVVGLATGKVSNRAALALYKSYNEKATGVRSYEMRQTKLGSRDLSSGRYLRGAADFIKKNKWETLDIVYNKAAVFVTRGWDSFVMVRLVPENRNVHKIIEYAWLPVMIAGLIGMLRLRDSRNSIIFRMTISYVVFITILAIFKVRYRLMIEPMLIIFAAILITDLFKRNEAETTDGTIAATGSENEA
ncbi:MAG: glycosyltransferase family 39 protein [Bacteroidales bacterium]|nr:glycosyltransferase family 39 protein [Candidatus Latescibacterota bacterium]